MDAYEWFSKANDSLLAACLKLTNTVDGGEENESCWLNKASEDSALVTYDPLDAFVLGKDGFHKLPAADVLADDQFRRCCLALYDSVVPTSSYSKTLFPMEHIKRAMVRLAKKKDLSDELFLLLSQSLTEIAGLGKCKEYSRALNVPILLCVGAREAALRILDSRACTEDCRDLRSYLLGHVKAPQSLKVRGVPEDEYDESHVWSFLELTAADLRTALTSCAEKTNNLALVELSKVLWSRLLDYHRLVLFAHLEKDPCQKWGPKIRDYIPEGIMFLFDTLARIAGLIASMAGVQDKPNGIMEALNPKYQAQQKAMEAAMQNWSKLPSQHPPLEGLGPMSQRQMTSNRYRPYGFPSSWLKAIKG